MNWINEIIEKRRTKTMTDREQYAALIRKGAAAGDLSVQERQKLLSLADTLRISPEQIEADAIIMKRYIEHDAMLHDEPSAVAERERIDAVERQAAVEIAEAYKRVDEITRQVEKERMAVSSRLNVIASGYQVKEIIEKENPHLFPPPSA